MKTQFRKIGTLLTLALLMAACGNSDTNTPTPPPTPSPNCATTSSEFQTIFSVAGNVTYDFDVHSYDFVLSANKTICKFGYQSTVYNTANPYTIKIKQGSTVLYSQPHVFSSSTTSYVTAASTVNLTAGVTYTIEREQTNSGPLNMENIGRIKMPATFPASSGIMSVVSSKFYFVSTNGTSTLTNTAMPFIDIIFQ